jgi:hypothetical protein
VEAIVPFLCHFTGLAYSSCIKVTKESGLRFITEPGPPRHERGVLSTWQPCSLVYVKVTDEAHRHMVMFLLEYVSNI